MIPSDVLMKMAIIGLNEEQARAVAEMLLAVEQATQPMVAPIQNRDISNQLRVDGTAFAPVERPVSITSSTKEVTPKESHIKGASLVDSFNASMLTSVNSPQFYPPLMFERRLEQKEPSASAIRQKRYRERLKSKQLANGGQKQ